MLTMCKKSDFRIALISNAFSTHPAFFHRALVYMVKSQIHGTVPNLGPTTPLSTAFLDTLSAHAKVRLMETVEDLIIRLAKSKSNVVVTPALVETYSRLLVYENRIGELISKLLIKSQKINILVLYRGRLIQFQSKMLKVRIFRIFYVFIMLFFFLYNTHMPWKNIFFYSESLLLCVLVVALISFWN